MDQCLIHYFSGTGNTYHLIKSLEKNLQGKGYKVNIVNVEKANHYHLDNYNLHIFCFPVYGVGTPAIMLKYMEALPNVSGINAAIICTSAGFEGQSIYHTKHLLKKKGFHICLTEMVVYPYNWTQVMNPPSKEVECKTLLQAGARVVEITERLSQRLGGYKRRNVIIVAISWIIFSIYYNLGRRLLGTCYVADNSCNGCGLCVKACPSKVIQLDKNTPQWKLNCEGCQRCINLCPQKSIQVSLFKLILYVVFELAAFLIFPWNHATVQLPLPIICVIFLILFAINTLLANIISAAGKSIRGLDKLFQISYTKNFRRNLAEGYGIREINCTKQ